MSRVLADLLEAHNPSFRLGLMELERQAGLPRVDIKLGVEVTSAVRRQLSLLGLDPSNTTGPELFTALNQRLLTDEATAREALGVQPGASSTELLTAVHGFLSHETVGKKVFALKPTAMRTLLKKLKPKTTMKALGYRSMDSMFKHESVLQLLVATQFLESKDWQHARLEAYKKFKASDFELREIQYVLPMGKHWPEIARRFTVQQRQNIFVSVEMGGVVILPLEVDLKALALTSVVLGLQAFESLRAKSALLKMHHVGTQFTQVLLDVVDHEPMTELTLAGHVLPWQFAHWFYGSNHAPYHPDLFEPHLQPEDFDGHDIYAPLEKLHSGLGFWRDGDTLAFIGNNDKPVSFNLLDVALGVCNELEYSARYVYHAQSRLWRELLGRYLSHESLHELLEDTLGRQLNPEPVFDERENETY